jgi:hypothetical protein
MVAGNGSGITNVDAELLDGIDSAAFATESELLTAVSLHAGSPDHDDRYFTETELATSGSGGSVHWDNLDSMPAGFADGTDDIADYTVGEGIIIDGNQIRVDPVSFVPQIALIDGGSAVGQCSSVAVGSDGLALVAYYDSVNENLKVAHCEDASCRSATISALDSIGGPGAFTSVAIGTDGFGLIGYVDQTSNELKVAHCSNSPCTAATISTVEVAGPGVRYPSVAIGADGNGLIAYVRGNDDLMVAHCSNLNCTSSGLSVVDSAADADSPSVAIGTDGLALISYIDATGETLKVAHCSNTACDASITVTLAPVGPFSSATSIAIGADGLGLVSYVPDAFGQLRTAHCADTHCTSATSSLLTDTMAVGSSSTSIAFDSSGLGLISYFGAADHKIHVARCTNAQCSAAVSGTIDSFGSDGSHSSIAVGPDGRAWISYNDAANGGLKVAHLPYGH